jgi:hypothetical protein
MLIWADRRWLQLPQFERRCISGRAIRHDGAPGTSGSAAFGGSCNGFFEQEGGWSAGEPGGE